MRVHFSIDDVCDTLRWCAYNQPKSIFDMDFFGDLKKWHEKHGIKATLYCFFKNKDFCVTQLPDRYCEELRKEHDWLRLAYHGSMDEKAGKEVFQQEKEAFEKILGREDVSAIRLHRWNAPKGVVDNMTGVLLCPDHHECLPYDLSVEEWDRLKSTGTIEKGKRTYWITDFRFDNMEKADELDRFVEKERLIIFGHEWMYKQKRRLIAEMLERLGNADYMI